MKYREKRSLLRSNTYNDKTDSGQNDNKKKFYRCLYIIEQGKLSSVI